MHKSRTFVPEVYHDRVLGWKRYPKDVTYSNFIRSRAGWKCERCGRTPKSLQGLHCAHIYSKWIMSTRWDSDNAVSLCNKCHVHFATSVEEFHQWVITKIGYEKYLALYRRATK